MKLTLLGTGTPRRDVQRAGPSQHLQLGATTALVDCGNGAVRRMTEAGLDPNVDYLFITHLHSDHTIDLAHVLITGWIEYRKQPWRIVGPAGTREFVGRVIHAFEEDIRVRRLYDRVGAEVMTPLIQEVGGGDTVTGGSWQATAIEVEHGYVKPALGYKFAGDGAPIVISGDTRPCDAIMQAAQGAGLLVHEMSTWNPDHCDKHGPGSEGLTEFQQRIAQSHSCVHDVGKLAEQAGVPRLAVSHMSPGVVEARVQDVVSKDYRGAFVVGRDLMTL
jgi:ribonuclease Z